jgi:Trypsin-like peptidase domain/Sel1 repeat
MRHKKMGEPAIRFVMVGLVLGIALCSRAIAQMQMPNMQQFQQKEHDRIMNLKRGIVPIETTTADGERDEGTGFVLSFNSDKVTILTALHVVSSARSIEVAFYDAPETFFDARKLPGDDPTLDLAIIEVDSSPRAKLPSDLPTFNFAMSSTMQEDSQISTANGDWILVPNMITRLSHEGDAEKFEYTNTSVGKGFSGGPVFDGYGDIVGMHEAMRGDGKFSIGVKIDAALHALEGLGFQVPEAGPIVNPYLAEFGLAPAKVQQPTIPDQPSPRAAPVTNPSPLPLKSTLSAAKQQADVLWKQNRYGDAVPLYQKACSSGEQEACISLGWAYFYGNGIQINDDKAEDLWSTACDAGAGYGCGSLVAIERLTSYGRQGAVTALPFAQKGCLLNDADSCFTLGLDYWNGIAVAQDQEKAKELFQKACNLGVKAGCDPSSWSKTE